MCLCTMKRASECHCKISKCLGLWVIQLHSGCVMERLIKFLSVNISKMPQSYKGRLTMILLLVAIPFPYTAVASHAWKQDADRQLFGPIVLSQHCMWCFTPCTRVSFRPSVPQSTGQHCATWAWSATGEVSTPDATWQTTAWAPSSDTCWHQLSAAGHTLQLDVPQALILSQIHGTGHKKMARVPPPVGLRGWNPKCHLDPWLMLLGALLCPVWSVSEDIPVYNQLRSTRGDQGECCHCK